MSRPLPTARSTRIAVAIVLGLGVWQACRLSVVPEVLRAGVAFLALSCGGGVALLLPVRRRLDGVERFVLSAVIGAGIAPVALDLFGRAGAGEAAVPLLFVAASVGLFAPSRVARANTLTRRDAWALAFVVLVVCAIAVVIAWPRVSAPAGARVRVFGDYDVQDMTYYTAIAGELTHTQPPMSPFLSGHRLVYSYYPLLLMAAATKAAGADLLRFCLQQAWPMCAGLSSAVCFLLCRRLGSLAFATTATLLVFTGEGLAGLLGLFRPGLVETDPMVWSSVFLAPSATWLYFNTWGPALVVLVGVCYALSRIEESEVWVIVAGALVAVLPQVKVFGYLVMVPAMCASSLVLWWRRDRSAMRMVRAAVLGVVGSLPWILPLVVYRDESRSFLTPAWLTQPKRMLFKLGLEGPLGEWAAALGIGTASGAFVLTVAVALFLAGGIGFRWVGVRSLWRAAMARPGTDATGNAVWTVMAWFVIVACLVPFVVTVEPHPNGVQPYVAGLLLAWVFAVDGWIGRSGRAAGWRWVTLASAGLVSVVPLYHYAAQAAVRQRGEPWVVASADDRLVAQALGRFDPKTVVVLHDNPDDPSLISIMAARRVVVGWLDTVGWADTTESNQRASDVEAFFSGRLNLEQGRAMLRRYGVTHIVEHPDRNAIDPELLAELIPVLRLARARLYQVPDDIAGE